MPKVLYHGSEGPQDVETMHLAKLANCIRKVERTGPSHRSYGDLEAIKAIYDRRQAAWDAENS